MARVPYEPFSTAEPTTQGTSYEAIPTNPAAFGAGVAEATERLGAGVGQDADQLQQAALRMQDLNNQADAQNALGHYVQQAGALDAQYRSLSGKSAADAYPAFLKSVGDLREQVAGTLKSPAAQVAFSQSARYLETHLTLGASQYAAAQQQQWWKQSKVANIDTMTNLAVQNAANPALVTTAENSVSHSISALGTLNNWDDATTTAQTTAAVGRFYQSVIAAKMGTPPDQGGGPQAALAMFNAVRGKLDAESIVKIQGMLHPVLKDQEGDAIVGQALTGTAGTTGTAGGAPNTDIHQAIVQKASAIGIPPDVPLTIAAAESSLGTAPDKKGNPHTGVFQMGPDEWRSVGGTDADRGNPTAQAERGTAFVARDITTASNALGRPAQGWEAYVVHVQGATGGADLLTAPKDQNVIDALLPATGSRAAAIAQVTDNGGTPDMTVGKFLGTYQDRYAKAASTVGNGGTSTAPGWQMPDWSKAEERVLQLTQGDDEARNIALSKLGQTKNRIEMATATERANLEKTQGDLTNAALAGLPIDVPTDRIRAVFPPDEADRRITDLGIAQGAGQVLAGIKWGSPQDVQRVLTDLTTGVGTVSDKLRAQLAGTKGLGTVTTPAGPEQPASVTETPEAFGMRTRIAALALQQIQARAKALMADAGGYVATEPTVAAAAKTMDPQKPDTFENFARTSLAVQDHLGVPAVAQHVLTMPQAQDEAGKLTAPGVDMKMQMEGLAKQWGAAWPHVFGDLVTLGKLPGAYQSVAVLDDPKDAALLARAINETSKGGRDWTDILG